MAEQDAQKKGKGVIKLVLLASLLSFTAGGAAGVLAWQKLNAGTEPVEEGHDEQAEKSDTLPVYVSHSSELSLGRIVVTLAATGAKSEAVRRLLIEPIIVYKGGHGASGDEKKKDDGHGEEKGAAPSDPVASKRAEVRDAYIEYLSQLTIEEVQGSHAIMKVKADLLRRARLVSESELPEAVLMNEFLVQ